MSVVSRISDDDYDQINKRSKVDTGDILLAMIGTIGNPVLVMSSDFAIKNVALIKKGHFYSNEFLLQVLKAPFFKSYVSQKNAGNTQKFLGLGLIRDFTFWGPSKAESIKVSSFLRHLDNTIALQQEKLNLLKQLKRGYLQKLFPVGSAKQPELRFAGFDGDWVQRKLSGLATMNARIGWQNLRTSEFLETGEYMLITGTDFQDGKVDYSGVHFVQKERYDQDRKIQVHDGSILITKDGTLGKVALVEGLSVPATLNAGVFNVRILERDEVETQYLYQYLKAPFLMKYANKKSTGGTIKHLNQNILVNFPVPLPGKAEQHNIAKLLGKLDQTIALQQRKLESLQALKQAYLQKLFV